MMHTPDCSPTHTQRHLSQTCTHMNRRVVTDFVGGLSCVAHFVMTDGLAPKRQRFENHDDLVSLMFPPHQRTQPKLDKKHFSRITVAAPGTRCKPTFNVGGHSPLLSDTFHFVHCQSACCDIDRTFVGHTSGQCTHQIPSHLSSLVIPNNIFMSVSVSSDRRQFPYDLRDSFFFSGDQCQFPCELPFFSSSPSRPRTP